MKMPKLPGPADKIVAEFADKLEGIQPSIVEGLYLTGSIPMNDFHPNKSDIDFLVFCKEQPDEKTVLQLKNIHRTIENRYPLPRLSGSYITHASIQISNPETVRILSYEKSLHYETFAMAPVTLSELKTNAVTVIGIQADTLNINIGPDKLNDFLFKNINSYWAKWIKQHSSFLNSKIILFMFPRFTEWAVLGVARQLCTLQTGKIVSKSEAGYYCLKHLPGKFHPIINKAIQIRNNNRIYPFVKSYAINPSFKRTAQTIACVNFIISIFNKTYSERKLKNSEGLVKTI
jgi:hypothetical protein